MRTLSLALALALSPVATASAEVFELADGTSFEGAYIGEADGTITVLRPRGGTVELDREQVERIDWSHELGRKYKARIERARKQFERQQRQAIGRLLRRYKRANAEERAGIEARLDRTPPELLTRPLSELLKARDADSRSLAVRRLAKTQSSEAVGPLVRTALTTKDGRFAQEAHRAARKVDSTLTRRFYEQVAVSNTKPVRRVRALGFLRGMGDEAVPGLVRVVEHVNTEIKATLATAGGIRRVPVNLGTSGAAGTQVPIELPEVDMVQIKTSAAVPVKVLRSIRSSAVQALQGITGQRYGDDAEAWKRWLKKRPKETHSGH